MDRIVWLLVGGAISICVQRILARLGEKRFQLRVCRLAFRGFPDYHRQLFFEGLTSDNWESRIPPHLRDHCITFVVFLESVGKGVGKDVRITAHAKNGSGIAAYTFLVAKTAICGRLTTTMNEDKELIGTWKYINPGDEIELHLLVAGIDDPDNVEIGVDGEDVHVTDRLMLQKSVQAIVSAGQTPMSDSKSLESTKETASSVPLEGPDSWRMRT